VNEPINVQNYIRSALFVDFDNVFLQLRSEDESVAERFAQQPDRWLSWLTRYASDQLPGVGGAQSRRVLVRRAYLNPRAFDVYRAPLIRCGFEVIDCPPLTTRGKTSTDIRMVMDILEAISHSTRFDEFVLMSSDADFTPVMARLRKHDRFTFVVSLGQAAAAYRAACDHIVEQDEFIEHALDFREQEEARAVQTAVEKTSTDADLLGQIAARVAHNIEESGPITASQLPNVYRGFSEFCASDDWLGFGSLRKLTQAVVDQLSPLDIDDGADPWEVRLVPDSDNDGAGAPVSKEEVSKFICSIVGAAQGPIALASLAHQVGLKYGDSVRSNSWQGAGSFKAYISELDLDSVRLSNVGSGFVYDSSRHEPPSSTRESANSEDWFESEQPEIAKVAKKINYVTDMPYLSTRVYHEVLRQIVNDVNLYGYHLTLTSRRVRDRCIEQGLPVARSHVNFILRGLSKGGHRFSADREERVETLANALLENTFNLCEWAELKLSDEERQLVREWVCADFIS
jgi:hypothetical protein